MQSNDSVTNISKKLNDLLEKTDDNTELEKTLSQKVISNEDI